MVRLVNVIIPSEKCNLVMSLLEKKRFMVKNITYYTTVGNVIINFKLKPMHLESVMLSLTEIGCGQKFGVIDVTELVATRPRTVYDKTHVDKKKYRITDRMGIDEIRDVIDGNNHLTFDYMALVLMASCLSCAGLLADNVISIIASMLVSPLMGPILGVTFGMAVNDVKIFRKGLRNEVIGMLICFTLGFLVGCVAAPAYNYYGFEQNSYQMAFRGTWKRVFIQTCVAAPSGVAVVVAVSRGGVNAVVGSAISASLLPPIVNCGICLAFAMLYTVGDQQDNYDYYMKTGLISLLLWVESFAIISLFGFLTFRFIKGVEPLPMEEVIEIDAQYNQSMYRDTSPGNSSPIPGSYSPTPHASYPFATNITGHCSDSLSAAAACDIGDIEAPQTLTNRHSSGGHTSLSKSPVDGEDVTNPLSVKLAVIPDNL